MENGAFAPMDHLLHFPGGNALFSIIFSNMFDFKGVKSTLGRRQSKTLLHWKNILTQLATNRNKKTLFLMIFDPRS